MRNNHGVKGGGNAPSEWKATAFIVLVLQTRLSGSGAISAVNRRVTGNLLMDFFGLNLAAGPTSKFI